MAYSATATDLIESALREISVLSGAESADAPDAEDGLQTLNRLIDGWETQRLQIYTVTRTTWTIVASTGQYTVGSGGNVNIERPIYVNHVNFVDTTQSPEREYELSKLTDDGWAAISSKERESTWPEAYYYNPVYPLATVDLWPVPNIGTLEGAIYYPEAVSQISALTSTIALPPGYARMIVKSLAVEMAPSYGYQPDPLLVKQANDAIGDVKRANIQLQEVHLDRAALIGGRLRRAYDIYRS